MKGITHRVSGKKGDVLNVVPHAGEALVQLAELRPIGAFDEGN